MMRKKEAGLSKGLMKRLILTSLCVLIVTGTSFGDWVTPKWVQLPDVTQKGLDVRADSPVVLADDFLCTDPGPITDIHIWGSWLGDSLPRDGAGRDGAGNVAFTLSIHSDIPQGQGGANFSYPGESLWQKTFSPGEFGVRSYLTGLKEGWYDPSTGQYISSDPPQGGPPADTICWQYNFLIDERPFIQEGTPENPIVYWLEVQANPADQTAQFGWKTSLQHWNDDAVWMMPQIVQSASVVPGWQELRYPEGHPLYPQSIDMAFVITTPEPGTILLFSIAGWVISRRRKNSFRC